MWAVCGSAWRPATRTAFWPPRWKRFVATDLAKHVRRLVELVAELHAVEVVVGLPRTLANRTGPSARDAIELAEVLADRIAPIPVRLADERLTTVSAQRSLRQAGVRAKGQRRVIDQAAAVAILQGWLDERRAMLPGEVNGV